MNHSFNVQVATQYGMNAAVILENLGFWCYKNLKNEKHIYDGLAWTYNSVKAFGELFPYMSQKSIRSALNTLEESGLIASGNFNENQYDRTKWYAVTAKGYEALNYDLSEMGNSICQNGNLHLPKRANGFADSNKSIISTDVNTDINTDNKPDTIAHFSDPQFEEEFETIWALYPRKAGKKQALRHFKAARKKGIDLETIKRGVEAYARKVKAEGTETRYILQGDTFFRNARWDDDFSTHDKFGAPNNEKLEQLKAAGFSW